MSELEISQKALDRAEKKQLYRNKLRVCIDNLVCPRCGSDLESTIEGKIGTYEGYPVLKCVDCEFRWKRG